MEDWRPVVGFEDRYEVNSAGAVRSLVTLGPDRIYIIRRPQLMNRGYHVLKLSKVAGARQFTKTVHSMVAEAFHGVRPEGFQVNHKDGNKLNNHASNLEWVSPVENVQHAIEIGLKPSRPGMRGPYRPHTRLTPQHGDQNYNSKISEHEAVEILRRVREGESCPSLARQFGVSTSLIRAIKTGRRWGHLPR